MQIKSSFDVPRPPPEAWNVLMDIPRIAPCMPGAELVEQVDDRTFKGKVSVKLGPVALAFAGTATFVEIDETAHRAKVKAQGADSKGRGSASADISFELVPAGTGTQVNVVTDVMLTGSVAQYGRASGVIQGVATQLVNQFAASLKASLSQHEPMGADIASPGDTPPPFQAAGAKPISGFSLMFQVLWNGLRGLLGLQAKG